MKQKNYHLHYLIKKSILIFMFMNIIQRKEIFGQKFINLQMEQKKFS